MASHHTSNKKIISSVGKWKKQSTKPCDLVPSNFHFLPLSGTWKIPNLGILHLLFPLAGMSFLGLCKPGSHITEIQICISLYIWQLKLLIFYCMFLQVNAHSKKTRTLFCVLLGPWCLEQPLSICWMNKWMTRSFLHAFYGLHSITNFLNS